MLQICLKKISFFEIYVLSRLGRGPFSEFIACWIVPFRANGVTLTDYYLSQ